MFVHVTKYICAQHLYEDADACTAKWKLWRARLSKINTVFMAAVSIHVTKPVCQIDFYFLLGNHLV